MNVTHFATAAAFRRWLEEHHAAATELQVGFCKKSSGQGGLTYAEAVDEALCFGWIDGIVRSLDTKSYARRFTPRQAGSIWSNLNVRHVARLATAGKMHSAGLAAFAARTAAKTGVYSFEAKEPAELPAAYARIFRANKKAWAFFSAQAPWYRRLAIHKIVSAKQAATRERWLARVIADSAADRRFDAASRRPVAKE